MNRALVFLAASAAAALAVTSACFAERTPDRGSRTERADHGFRADAIYFPLTAASQGGKLIVGPSTAVASTRNGC